MAARQDQGLVFTLIAFVILFIIAFVAAYVGWKSYSDAQKQIAQLQTDKAASDQAATNMQADKEQLLKWTGVGAFDNLNDVKERVEADLNKWGATFPEDQRSYRKIVEYLTQENQAIAGREAKAKEDLKDLKDRLLAVEAENAKKVEQFQAQMQAAEQDAAQERDQHRKDREGLENTKRELQENLAKQESKYEDQLAAINTQLKDLTAKLSKSEVAKENLLAEVSKSAESFEVPDGRVSWVNQNGTVWINLGAADGLRRQITFSVFDADALDPAKTDPKGSLEVTKILGDHMAEARVTGDDPRNPILTGDQIYSQVWHRGKRLRFALMGIVDIDGDGRNDMQMARDLIELNGGIVDAYVADDGKVEGAITVNTRYLVMGDHPEGATEALLQDAWVKLSDDAQTNGVEKITMDKFLNQIGYAPDQRVVQLGAGARAVDFPARPESGPDALQGEGPQFRPRSPNRATSPDRQTSPSGATSSPRRYFRFSP